MNHKYTKPQARDLNEVPISSGSCVSGSGEHFMVPCVSGDSATPSCTSGGNVIPGVFCNSGGSAGLSCWSGSNAG